LFVTPLPWVANAKTLKDIFEWIYVVACAFLVFVLDDLLYYFPQNIFKINQRNLFESMKSVINKSPASSAGLHIRFGLKTQFVETHAPQQL
jgi:hypothetical protein